MSARVVLTGYMSDVNEGDDAEVTYSGIYEQLPDWLDVSDLVAGQYVAYSGPDSSQGIYNPNSTIKVLRRGHPGIIYDATPQHVRVEWAGLEEEPASFADGFCCEPLQHGDRTDVGVPGLVKVSHDDYARLAARFAAGPPTHQ
ncbi:hypothetical protein [Rhodococcus sovatensis]|uniref:Uncharacterized protein n=1 Tax=Rhodococcus sovatensis TaxID=1805840 RepID=A0ABZ2PVG1_9NOCA